jgi:putative MFS transporter
MGRLDEACQSLAWALQIDPQRRPLSTESTEVQATAWRQLFKYPHSLLVSWLGNLGAQTGLYGLGAWLPTLFVQVLGISAARASYLIIYCTLGGLVGRVGFAYLSDVIGRRASGGLLGFGVALMEILAGYLHNTFWGTISLFWVLLVVAYFFADGGFSIVGPYSAEVWPASLRASGMGSAYGFGGIGKIIGPLGLGLIVGSSNIVNPQASVARIIPAFIYLGAWYALSGTDYSVFALETKGRSLEEIYGEFAKASSDRKEMVCARR